MVPTTHLISSQLHIQISTHNISFLRYLSMPTSTNYLNDHITHPPNHPCPYKEFATWLHRRYHPPNISAFVLQILFKNYTPLHNLLIHKPCNFQTLMFYLKIVIALQTAKNRKTRQIPIKTFYNSDFINYHIQKIIRGLTITIYQPSCKKSKSFFKNQQSYAQRKKRHSQNRTTIIEIYWS